MSNSKLIELSYRAALPGRKSGTHDAQKRRRLL